MNKEHFGQKIRKNFWSLREGRLSFVGLLMGAALLVNGPAAQADLIGLTLAPTPDIFVSNTAVTYSAGTDTLSAFGVATTLDLPPFTIFGDNDNYLFALNADVDEAGTLSGGTVSIRSDSLDITLITGDLTDFGFNNVGNLDFTFTVTGGDLATNYGGFGAVGGIIMAQTGSTGDFTADWSGSGAIADVAPVVPIPAAAWLFGSALISLVGVARRRGRADRVNQM